MVAYLRAHQLNIMLFESGMCMMLALLTLIIRTFTRKRKVILIAMELGSIILLLSDRYAYLYRGDVTAKGYWMVRISNFLVFFMTLALVHIFTLYLIDVYRNEEKLPAIPKRFKTAIIFFFVGLVLLIISQFTGLYYTFDENNLYQRSPAFVLCYVIPLLITAIQLSVILQYHKLMGRRMYLSLLLFTVIPLISSVVQLFAYGISLTNMTMVFMAIVVFLFAVIDVDKKAEKANKMEIRYLRQEQEKIRKLFGQTTEALADAIDAKDEYTRGHSSRVADYSVRIARAAGKSKRECEEIYYAALLHDVGKIGIPDSIINKPGKLTSLEYDVVKDHPVIGSHILSVITESPYLSIGAHYHHERYDGRGYPDGLVGKEIPEIARIIAVADSYDAMTSKRNYRVPFSQDRVRQEIKEGAGQQFDPDFAEIMIQLIDADTNFLMKEKE